MCPPDYYGIEYEINPWMSRSRASDAETARAQWRALHDVLVSVGAKVSLLEPKQGLPDLVFTANAALIYQKTAVLSRFRHVERQGEEPIDEAWLSAHGFMVRRLPPDIYFEGAGDALFCGEVLFAGYRIRSDVHGHQWLGQTLGVRVLPLELVNGYFYHLDTCFCPLAPGEAIWYPDAFDDYGKRVIETHVPKLIEVNEAEAKRFG